MLAHTRIGFGEDAHTLVSGGRLVLGGYPVPDSPVGPEAHSDGDALLHAVSDALLSAFALGDIGQYFPPSNPNYRDLDSQVILQNVMERITDAVGPFLVHNVAAVVTMDQPKLGPHRVAMQRQLAELLGLDPSRVGIGFKSTEGIAADWVQARVTLLVSSE